MPKKQTDLEAFIDLYKRFGIKLETEIHEGTGFQIITLESCESEKLIGYPGFMSLITFNPSGKFIEQGFYK